jgi:hypothetical protein
VRHPVAKTWRLNYPEAVEARLSAKVEAREAATAALQTTMARLAEVLERTRQQLEVTPASGHSEIHRLALDLRRLLLSQSVRRPKPSRAQNPAPQRWLSHGRRVSKVSRKTVRRPVKRSRKR